MNVYGFLGFLVYFIKHTLNMTIWFLIFTVVIDGQSVFLVYAYVYIDKSFITILIPW